VANIVIFFGQTIFWQAGIVLSQRPLGRHLTDETPIKLFPLVHSNSTTVLRTLSLWGTAFSPVVGSIIGHWTCNNMGMEKLI
jgi:hypothetical protein